MGSTYRIKAVCEEPSDGRALEIPLRAARDLGWKFGDDPEDRFALIDGYEVPPEDRPRNITEAINVASGETLFSVTLFQWLSNGSSMLTVGVERDPTHGETEVFVYTITNARKCSDLRRSLFSVGIDIANHLAPSTLAGGVDRNIPPVGSLPSSERTEKNGPDSPEDLTIADITLFPPGAVEGIGAAELAEHGLVVRTAGGSLLTVSEILFPYGNERHDTADALGLNSSS